MSDIATPKNLSQIKSPNPPSEPSPTSPKDSTPLQTPPPAAPADPPASPSLEEKINNLDNQGPITTLINEQLASRIEQKIEQKLDHELSDRTKPDLTKWIMVALGIAMLLLWIAWSGRLIFTKWF